MNHYQITGVVILIGLIILATLTFWPSATTPSTAVVDGTKTTTPAPKDATGPGPNATNSGAGVRTYENGVYVTTIFYTKTGFVPAQLTLTRGEEVRFINKTSGVMHIIGDEKLSSKYYGLINQQNSLAKDDTYQLKMAETGIFIYNNLNSNPLRSGQIVVK